MTSDPVTSGPMPADPVAADPVAADPVAADRASVLLGLPGAVAAGGVDTGVAAHYGSFYGEQRTLAAGDGFTDLSHRDVIRVTGPDRLGWLHSLTTQHFESLAAGVWTTALILSPHGRIEHALCGYDDGEGAFTAHTEPGAGAPLAAFLERMRFMLRVEVSRPAGLAVVWRPAAGYEFVPRERLAAYAGQAGPACGLWAYEALRIARGEPRLGLDTDHRTIPNETSWMGSAVHLDKGCYPGQETVARVYNVGRPPRRLTLLHLDGSENRLPAAGAELRIDTGPGGGAVEDGGAGPGGGVGPHGGAGPGGGVVEDDGAGPGGGAAVVGFAGTSARHHELGPIALGMVKRGVPVGARLVVEGLPANQEVIVDPETGLHVLGR